MIPLTHWNIVMIIIFNVIPTVASDMKNNSFAVKFKPLKISSFELTLLSEMFINNLKAAFNPWYSTRLSS